MLAKVSVKVNRSSVRWLLHLGHAVQFGDEEKKKERINEHGTQRKGKKKKCVFFHSLPIWCVCVCINIKRATDISHCPNQITRRIKNSRDLSKHKAILVIKSPRATKKVKGSE